MRGWDWKTRVGTRQTRVPLFKMVSNDETQMRKVGDDVHLGMSSVGWTVGRAVGWTVGRAVGWTVGRAIGRTVGRTVGWTVGWTMDSSLSEIGSSPSASSLKTRGSPEKVSIGSAERVGSRVGDWIRRVAREIPVTRTGRTDPPSTKRDARLSDILDLTGKDPC
jgi:hypothetical protein